MLLAGGKGGHEQLHVQEVVRPDGAQHVLDHALGAGAQQVAELGRVRIWTFRVTAGAELGYDFFKGAVSLDLKKI